eukprot:m.17571 g.17571  ORF g.17571 m.17571 type:complete len:296 (+) comp8317_c0_seq2:115-1002(+)
MARASGVFAQCRAIVKQSSREHYLTALLLPDTAVNSVFALRAFNAQVARVRDDAREPNAVRMRYLFWSDVIDGLKRQNNKEADASTTPSQLRHPVALALQEVAKEHDLTLSFLRQLIRARQSQSDDAPFQTLQEAETYAEQTCSSLYYLTLECMNIRNQHADHVASHLGRAEGLVTLLRGIPYLAAQGKVRLPLDVCANHGVVQQELVRGKTTPALQDAAHVIASEAVLHMNTARGMMKDVPSAARPCFLPAVCLNNYLNDLLKVDFDVFHPSLQTPKGLLPLRLLWAKFRRSYP